MGLIKFMRLFSLISLFFTLNLYSTIKVESSEKKTGVNNQIIITVEFEDEEGPLSIESRDFKNLGRRSSSTSISIANGVYSKRSLQTFVLQPLKTGELSFQVVIGSNKSKVHKINVIDGHVPTKNNRPSRNKALQNDPFFQQFTRPTQPTVKPESIIIENQIAKKNLYLNEITTMDTVLYYSSDLAGVDGINIIKKFSHPGISKVLFNKGEVFTTTVKRNGKSYRRVLIMKHLIFPLVNPGKRKQIYIANGVFKVFIRGFFNSQSYDIKVKPIGISVEKHTALKFPVNSQLNPYSRPFSNPSATIPYGDFKVKAELSTTNTKVDEPITLKITVSGTGNFMTLTSPINLKKEALLSDQIRIDLGPIKKNYETISNNFSGNKVFTYYLTPKASGEIKLNPTYFTVYASKKKAVVHIPIYFSNLSVTGIKKSVINSQTKIEEDSSKSKLINEEIHYINEKLPISNSSIFFNYHLIAILLGLFLLLFLRPTFPFISFSYINHLKEIFKHFFTNGSSPKNEIQISINSNYYQKQINAKLIENKNFSEVTTLLQLATVEYLLSMLVRHHPQLTAKKAKSIFNLTSPLELLEQINHYISSHPISVEHSQIVSLIDRLIYKVKSLSELLYSGKSTAINLKQEIEDVELLIKS